jgi:hypothetical protein
MVSGCIKKFYCVIIAAAVLLLNSCSRLGWGILLWPTEDPAIPSGTILPVYIKSDINQTWVTGVPDSYKGKLGRGYKIEIPLWQFELVGSKKKAAARAQEFVEYASLFAEILQDGLPVRDNPDNGARRVYRLRVGEIVKILSIAQGNPPISTTGDPLPGEWYRVLTESGSKGYCFSYRLRLFEHYGGQLAALPSETQEISDPDLDMVLSKTWSPDFYGVMINNGRINLEELSRNWRFDPGQEMGVAHIYLPQLERTFTYNRIRREDSRTWLFEGTSLRITLRSDTSLMVQFNDENSGMRTLQFIVLSSDVNDIILQESARREGLYRAIYAQGPVFTSNNYGTIFFMEDQRFTWTGYSLLVPHVISPNTVGRGTVSMDIFLSASLAERYSGALSLRFTGTSEPLRFLYLLDSQGFRLEYVPESSMDELTVYRRANSPTVLYFFKDTLDFTEN